MRLLLPGQTRSEGYSYAANPEDIARSHGCVDQTDILMPPVRDSSLSP